MQCFRVVYRGISHKSFVFSSYTREPLGECVYKEKTSDKLYYFLKRLDHWIMQVLIVLAIIEKEPLRTADTMLY